MSDKPVGKKKKLTLEPGIIRKSFKFWVGKFQRLPFLPQPNGFPPYAANSKPDDNIDNRYNESITPPLGKGYVISTIENRCWPDTIVSKTTHEVRKEAEY